MSAANIDQFKAIVRNGLCNRCGSCVGLSAGKIIFDDKEGRYLPRIISEPNDENMRLILSVCSGRAFNFPQQRERIFGPVSWHLYTGAYQSLNVGFAENTTIRSGAASGGLISAMLIYLLRKQLIKGAVVVRMSKDKPWHTEPFIATCEDEILEAAQSKYIITSVNEILPQIAAFDGRLAYVGLPGQIQSIRLLQEQGHPWVKNIDYIFGPFYGNTLHFSSVKSFIRSHGEKDFRQISKLYFRYGEWPGSMRVEMKNGRIFQLKKFHANYLIPFHIVKNSLICTDLANEFADVSGGDAWAPVYEERGKGFSMAIARSAKGENLIRNMEAEGWLNLGPIDLDTAISMHSHGYDLKKRGSFIRMRYMRFLGMKTPDYGYNIKGFRFSRYLMEALIDVLFVLLGTKLARRTVELLPPAFIGKMFEKSRTAWKKSTTNIKRKDL